MKLFSIFAMGIALTTACPPPFNNADLIGVDDEGIAAYIEEHRDNGTSGLADAVGDWRNFHKQWPREKARTERLIQYCYYDPGSKYAFEKIVGNALKMWFNKIGSAGEKTKHSLGVKEYEYPNGVLPYCRVPKSKDNRSPIWNPVVKQTLWSSKYSQEHRHQHTLLWDIFMKRLRTTPGVIRWPFLYPSALVQMILKRSPWWRTNLDTCLECGMSTNGRIISDHYVRFQCDKLDGYAKAVEDVKNKGKHDIHTVCSSATIGAEYGFLAPTQFSLERTQGSVGWHYVTKGGIYDWQSIMHYNSYVYQNGKLGTDPPSVPLFRWVKGGPDIKPPPESHPPKPDEAKVIKWSEQKVTNDLTSRIQQLYPWEDKPVGSR